ncbi:hypothetical protein H257_17954 [Aphanomyces astaci]|uniref:Uncharacterized protein n=1 Tax=Aphanomyces astaci TaxID=112090 RepID=W4FCT1_APHAT|nr:hypothetical protein H257_17954 [Aphanomyces astaci]ETV65307.1 hypothetical protein H257_17954 [Aphanomyces astaci]|eukprot:XP_009845233.1 hypothetical protein H257_17954 [Aphanomyces astaci]
MSAVGSLHEERLSVSSATSSKGTKPRFCVIKPPAGIGVCQLYLYKSDDLGSGNLVSTVSLDHSPTKSTTTLFAVPSQATRGSDGSGGFSSREATAIASSIAAPEGSHHRPSASITTMTQGGLVDSSAFDKCLKTFLSASVQTEEESGESTSPVQRHFDQLLRSKWHQEAAVPRQNADDNSDGATSSWVNEHQVDDIPNRHTSVRNNTSSFHWKPTDTSPAASTTNWAMAECWSKKGLGNTTSKRNALDLYYDVRALVADLEAYVANAKFSTRNMCDLTPNQTNMHS